MKLKSILIVLISMFVSNVVMAQSSYDMAVKEFITCDEEISSNLESMRSAFEEINKNLLSNLSETQSKTLIDEYMKGPFMDDMCSKVYAPLFKKYLTESDLKEITTMLTSPEGKRYTEHTNACNTSMKLKMMTIMMTAMANDGKPLKPNEKCSEEYQKLFSEYYDIATGNVVNEIFQGLAALKTQDMAAEQKQKIDKLMTFMIDNLKVIMMNSYVDQVTIEDIKYGISVCKKPSYTKLMKALAGLLEDPQALGMTVVTSYAEWLDKKGITAD